MKTWQEIKDNYAREHGYDDWEELVEYYIYWDNGKLLEHIDNVSLLRAKYALEDAGKNVELEKYKCDHCCCAKQCYCEGNIRIDKESITDENNIPL